MERKNNKNNNNCIEAKTAEESSWVNWKKKIEWKRKKNINNNLFNKLAFSRFLSSVSLLPPPPLPSSRLWKICIVINAHEHIIKVSLFLFPCSVFDYFCYTFFFKLIIFLLLFLNSLSSWVAQKKNLKKLSNQPGVLLIFLCAQFQITKYGSYYCDCNYLELRF